MNQVKGSLLTKIVKIIKADKSGAYDSYLTDEDKKRISGTILSATWYPYDLYKRCFNALADVHAKGNMDICRQWGRNESEDLTTGAYKSILTNKDYKIAFEKIQLYWKLMFDFGELEIDFPSDNAMQITVKDFDRDFRVFYYFVQGWYGSVFEMCGCKDVISEFTRKSWEDAGDTILRFSWSS